MRIAVIGVGSIGRAIIDGIRRGDAGQAELVALADQPTQADELQKLATAMSCPCTTDPVKLLDFQPDIVVEAAAQAVVRQYAVAILDGGVNLLVMSVGALVDPELFDQVWSAAERSGCRVYAPSGAIGGLDVLRSARVAGLEEVTLITSKPPGALVGARFFDDHPIDLMALSTRTVIYEGPAREAVRLFPENVNVAAALSLSGLGADRTLTQVVADPDLDRNTHEVVARGSFGEMRIRLSNVPSPANPKTSYLACLSPLATLRRLAEPIQIG